MGNIENSALQSLQQRHHGYCHNTALEYFTITTEHSIIKHETAIPSGMKPLCWYESVDFSISCWYKYTMQEYKHVHCVAIFCNTVYCTCNIIEM